MTISLSYSSIRVPWHVLMPRLRSKTNDLLGWLKLRYRGCFRVANGGAVQKQEGISYSDGGQWEKRERDVTRLTEREHTRAGALLWETALRRDKGEGERVRYLAWNERDERRKDEGGRGRERESAAGKRGCSPVSSTWLHRPDYSRALTHPLRDAPSVKTKREADAKGAQAKERENASGRGKGETGPLSSSSHSPRLDAAAGAQVKFPENNFHFSLWCRLFLLLVLVSLFLVYVRSFFLCRCRHPPLVF